MLYWVIPPSRLVIAILGLVGELIYYDRVLSLQHDSISSTYFKIMHHWDPQQQLE